MAETKRLRKFAGDFLLIVVGVLTALALESAWQARSDQRLERELLEAIRRELGENAGQLERWIQLNGVVSSSLESLVASLEGVAEGTAVEVPDSVIAHALRTPTFDPDQASLDAALTSGHITLVRSTDIQRALAQWARLLADAREEEEKGMELTISHLMPMMARHADLAPAMRGVAEWNRYLMRNQPEPLWPETRSEVRASKELVNLLMLRWRLSQGAVSELQVLQDGLGTLGQLIEDQIR